jgi:hypothetical protein
MPGKQVRSTSDSSSRSRSRFSYLTDAGTMLATVFSYLNGELNKALPQREGKQRAADALMAFWKPYALQAQQADAERVQKAAQSSVEALFRQMQTICDDFEVELPMMQSDVEVFAIAVAKHMEQRIEPFQAPISIATLAAHSSTNKQLLLENDAIFVDDEDLLGDLE